MVYTPHAGQRPLLHQPIALAWRSSTATLIMGFRGMLRRLLGTATSSEEAWISMRWMISCGELPAVRKESRRLEAVLPGRGSG